MFSHYTLVGGFCNKPPKGIFQNLFGADGRIDHISRSVFVVGAMQISGELLNQSCKLAFMIDFRVRWLAQYGDRGLQSEDLTPIGLESSRFAIVTGPKV